MLSKGNERVLCLDERLGRFGEALGHFLKQLFDDTWVLCDQLVQRLSEAENVAFAVGCDRTCPFFAEDGRDLSDEGAVFGNACDFRSALRDHDRSSLEDEEVIVHDSFVDDDIAIGISKKLKHAMSKDGPLFQ